LSWQRHPDALSVPIERYDPRGRRKEARSPILVAGSRRKAMQFVIGFLLFAGVLTVLLVVASYTSLGEALPGTWFPGDTSARDERHDATAAKGTSASA
jgi:hypothetical protein